MKIFKNITNIIRDINSFIWLCDFIKCQSHRSVKEFRYDPDNYHWILTIRVELMLSDKDITSSCHSFNECIDDVKIQIKELLTHESY